ncbi:MAG TPA: Crp/Fnr family transcriptional regulator [Pyrinomonadaceae bacterium]|nr:Crp/Fnr family transcriptional regulator [Pyrinomonadaceae bacterium]
MSLQSETDITRNQILARLPDEERERLRPYFEIVSLSHGDHVIVPDVPIRDVHFPLNCLLSLVTLMSDGACVESGIIGREGMSGIPVILDATQTTMPTFTQIPGEAVRIKAEIFKAEYVRRGALHMLMNRYMHTVVVIGSQTAACNALHQAEARFCRWLLMSADGIGSEELNITHEFLGVMLGVRRATVSEIAAKFQSEGIIAYKRGRLQILSRERLERSVCECYAKTRAEYTRLFA